MDRFFFIFWGYSCFTPSRLYHQRTVRFAIVRSPIDFFLVFLFYFFLDLCKLVWHLNISSLLYFQNRLSMITDFSHLSTDYIYSVLSFRMSLDTFGCCFNLFVCLHSYHWRFTGLASAVNPPEFLQPFPKQEPTFLHADHLFTDFTSLFLPYSMKSFQPYIERPSTKFSSHCLQNCWDTTTFSAIGLVRLADQFTGLSLFRW